MILFSVAAKKQIKWCIFRRYFIIGDVIWIPQQQIRKAKHMHTRQDDEPSKNITREWESTLAVEMTERPGWYRSYVKIQDNPKISIIIPNKDHIEDLELCLFSLTKRSTYKNYEILIVENNSEKPRDF